MTSTSFVRKAVQDSNPPQPPPPHTSRWFGILLGVALLGLIVEYGSGCDKPSGVQGRAQAGIHVTPGPVEWHSNINEAPSWAVRYGHEFWRDPSHALPAPKVQGADSLPPSAAGIDLQDVIARVRTGIRPVEGMEEFVAIAPSFEARFGGSGMSLRPMPPKNQAMRGALPGAFASFHSLRISQGNATLFDAQGVGARWSIMGNTAQALLDPGTGVIEHQEVRPEGVEVAWYVPKVIPGTGDLVVDAEITGYAYRGTKDGEMLFVQGPSKIRVSQALAVDKAGRQWPVPGEVMGGVLTYRLSRQILDDAAYPLVIDPTISVEWGIDDVLPPAASEAEVPRYLNGQNSDWIDDDFDGHTAIASNGTIHFLVRSICGINEPHAGSSPLSEIENDDPEHPPIHYDTNDAYIRAYRIDADTGDVLDPYGVVLTYEVVPDYADQGAYRLDMPVAVASNGEDFFLAWSKGQNPGTWDYANIYGVHVDIGADKKSLVGFVPNVVDPDEGGAAVGDGPLQLSTNGAVLFATSYPSPIVPTNVAISYVADTGNPSVPHYLVTWVDRRDGSGSVTQIGSSTDLLGRHIYDWDVRGQLINSDGTKSGTDTILITNQDSIPQCFVASAGRANNNLVAWNQRSDGLGCLQGSNNHTWDLKAHRFDEDGVAPGGSVTMSLDSTAPADPYYYQQFAVASNGTNFLVVWESRADTSSHLDIAARRIDTSDTLLGSGIVAVTSTANFDETGPLVTADTRAGGDYLVSYVYTNADGIAYEEASEAGDDDAQAVLLQSDQQTLYVVKYPDDSDTVGSAVAVDQASIMVKHPAISWAAPNYLVTWNGIAAGVTNDGGDDGGCGRRIADDGTTFIDSSPLRLTVDLNEAMETASVAGGDGYVLVAFTQHQHHVQWQHVMYPEVFSVLLTPDGEQLTWRQFGQVGMPYTGQHPSVAYVDMDPTGSHQKMFFIAWEEASLLSGTLGHSYIAGAALDINGSGGRVTISNDSNADFTYPTVAGVTRNSGTHRGVFVVAYAKDGVTIEDRVVHFVGGPSVIDNDGSPVTIVSGGGNTRVKPAIACLPAAGGDCLVAWEHNNDIHAWRVDNTGATESTELTVASTGNTEQAVALAAGKNTHSGTPQDTWLVSWQETTSVKARAVDTAGALGTTFTVASSSVASSPHPAVGWASSKFLVAWGKDSGGSAGLDIVGHLYTIDDATPAVITGSGSDFNISSLPGDQFDATASAVTTSTGYGVFVAWTDWRAGSTGRRSIYGTGVNLSNSTVSDVMGSPVTPYATQEYSDWSSFNSRVSVTYAAGADCDSGTGGTQSCYLVAWTDYRNYQANADAPTKQYTDIFGARVAATGYTVMDPNGIAIANSTELERNPSVAYGGSADCMAAGGTQNCFLVVYNIFNSSRWKVRAKLVQVDSPTTMTTVTGIGADNGTEILPDVAPSSTSSDGYLVVWRTYVAGGEDISMRRISPDGGTLNPGSPVGLAAGSSVSRSRPAVKAGSGTFLVVWQETPGGGTSDIRGKFVDLVASVPTEVTAVGSCAIATTGGYELYPRIGWNSDSNLFLVPYYLSGDIKAAKVTRNTSTCDIGTTITIANTSDTLSFPDIAYKPDSGGKFLVVWEGLGSNNVSGIYGVEVDKGGTTAPSGGDVHSIAVGDYSAAVTTTWGNGEFFVSYSRLVSSLSSWRAKLRKWTP